MSADREFNIKVKTEADNTGLQSATKAMDEGGKSAKLFAGDGLELRKAISELSREFPIAGEALRILTNPTSGAIAIGIAAFGYFKSSIDEMNKATDEMIKQNADPTFLESINAKKQALEDAALSFQHFVYEANHATSAEQLFQESVKRGIALIQEASQGRQSAADALFGLDEAKLKAEYENGLILFDQYQQKLAELEIKHRHEAEAAKEAEIKQEIHSRVGAADRAYFDSGNAALRVKDDIDKSTAAANRVKKDKDDLESLQNDRKIQDARAQELEDKGDFLYNPDTKKNEFTRLPEDQAAFDAANAAATADTQKITKINARLPDEESAEQTTKDELETAKADKKEADDALRENTKAIRELQDKLSAMHANATATQPVQDLTTLLNTNAGAQIYAAEKLGAHLENATGSWGDLARRVRQFESQIIHAALNSPP